MTLRKRPPDERFWEKVNKAGPVPAGRPGLGPCWEWTAGKTAQGYGGFHPTKQTMELSHRWAYRQFFGELSPALVVDHLCRNRACVNPGHLELVSNEENLRRGSGFGLRNGMRNTCIHGHAYTDENTYREPTGGVRCRECARIRDRHSSRNAAQRRRRYTQQKAAAL